MPRGKPPDLKRRQQIAELRAAGLSLTEIGRKLGVSRQSVHQQLQRSGQTIRRPGILCCVCGRMLGPRLRTASERGSVHCTACLPLDATLGQRLRAYRVAAQLTPADLAARTGVPQPRIYSWECDQKHPLPHNIARLGQVLGEACLNALLACNRRRGGPRRQTIFCRDCGVAVTEFVTAALGAGPVWCPQCLDKHAEATLGQRLLALRLAAGLSQRELAEAHGLWRASISWYERDWGQPLPETLAKLTRVLGAGLVPGRSG